MWADIFGIACDGQSKFNMSSACWGILHHSPNVNDCGSPAIIEMKFSLKFLIVTSATFL